MSQKEKVDTAATKAQTQEQAIPQETLKTMVFATPKPGETVTMAEAKKMTRTKSYQDTHQLLKLRGGTCRIAKPLGEVKDSPAYIPLPKLQAPVSDPLVYESRDADTMTLDQVYGALQAFALCPEVHCCLHGRLHNRLYCQGAGNGSHRCVPGYECTKLPEDIQPITDLVAHYQLVGIDRAINRPVPPSGNNPTSHNTLPAEGQVPDGARRASSLLRPLERGRKALVLAACPLLPIP